MRDFLGSRCMFGIPTPSVNTCVQPESDDMRPAGVTNHIARMHVPDLAVHSNEDFERGIEALFGALDDAVDQVMTCGPDHLILGISALSIWGGSRASSNALKARIATRAGLAGREVGVTLAGDAVLEALAAHGVKRRIAIVEPYYPVIQQHLESFFGEAGFEVVKFNHLQGKQFTGYTKVDAKYLIDALRETDTPDAEAIVQFGANLPMASLAAEAERWLGKPVIAVNIANYWHALRHNGIDDRVQGWSTLLSQF
ncbi:arylmalonate decarboxylase [Paraburkholderia sp. BCC1886]|uniref:maleate cis-trans isomerase family protein n=1 Tax=Paraburkholderia sp. BCC1886 TaxID=2562670 RepID=UPI001183ACF1|nr:arylmalonate decarboxylase [Paraburkholderia sp. BCC1886]